MKYKLLSFLFFSLFVSVIALAQTNVTNSSFTMYGHVDSLLEADVTAVLLGSSDVSIKVKRVPQTLVSGSINYFCWTICYGPGTNVSPSPITMTPNDSIDNFHGYYQANGNAGTSSIMYVFYDATNPDDSAYVTINYEASATPAAPEERYIVLDFNPTGLSKNIQEVNGDIKLITNPAIGNAKFAYNVTGKRNASVIIYNLLGKKIDEINLTEDKGIINYSTSSLSSGVYFYSLNVNDRVINSKKFIVTQ